MGLYRDMPRGASFQVDEPTVVYCFSSEAMARMEREEPALAHAFHRFVVRTLASSLDFANREVAGLQRCGRAPAASDAGEFFCASLALARPAVEQAAHRSHRPCTLIVVRQRSRNQSTVSRRRCIRPAGRRL